MLTGKAPFKSGGQRATLDLVIEGKLVPPRELNREVDQELQAVCLKCLHKDPGERYGSADALANDLKRWIRPRTDTGGKADGSQTRVVLVSPPSGAGRDGLPCGDRLLDRWSRRARSAGSMTRTYGTQVDSPVR